jgi:hypothetical protein
MLNAQEELNEMLNGVRVLGQEFHETEKEKTPLPRRESEGRD